MALEFDCPTCRTRIRVDESAAGKMARCPSCQAVCKVPNGSVPDSLPGTTPPASSPNPSSTAPNPFLPKANPFGEAASAGGSPAGGQLNPYASPAYVATPQGPLEPTDVRMKLLGPAIGIAIGAMLCSGYVGLTLIGLLINPQPNIPQDEAARIGYYIGLVGAVVAMALHSLGMLVGCVALFRGKGTTMAWIGVVCAVLPCNPCCLISLGFGIWGIIVLSDPNVKKVMQE